MKHKMKRKKLLTNDDIWNAVNDVVSEYDFPTDNEVANEVFLVLNYYSALESGGHENLFNGFSWYIEEVGIIHYIKELTSILDKINARDYSEIEKKFGEKLWSLYTALENNEIEEEKFYSVIEEADNDYEKLDGKLERLLETYFLTIYTELIEIID